VAEKKKPNLVYLAILAVAGGGLAFDKFVLSAEADTGEPVVAEVLDGQQTQLAAITTEIVREPLAARFNIAHRQLSQPALRRLDAFSEPPEDIVIQTSTDEAITPVGGGFASRHKLTSVLSQEAGDIAVVDGILIRVGETIEGVELIKVEPDGVIFRSGDTEIHLTLARPGLDR